MAKQTHFTLSRHARRRIRQRSITITQIVRTLTISDRLEDDDDDPEARHAIKRFHHNGSSVVLRVVYNFVATPPRVITAFFDRRLRRRL